LESGVGGFTNVAYVGSYDVGLAEGADGRTDGLMEGFCVGLLAAFIIVRKNKLTSKINVCKDDIIFCNDDIFCDIDDDDDDDAEVKSLTSKELQQDNRQTVYERSHDRFWSILVVWTRSMKIRNTLLKSMT